MSNYPMFTVLSPEPGTPRRTVHAEGLNGDTAPHTPWAFFAIDGTPGENFYDDRVEEEARKLGIEIATSRDCPLAIETVDAYEGPDYSWHHAGEERYVPAALAAGYTIVKLPDEIGSTCYRWYMVKTEGEQATIGPEPTLSPFEIAHDNLAQAASELLSISQPREPDDLTDEYVAVLLNLRDTVNAAIEASGDLSALMPKE